MTEAGVWPTAFQPIRRPGLVQELLPGRVDYVRGRGVGSHRTVGGEIPLKVVKMSDDSDDSDDSDAAAVCICA